MPGRLRRRCLERASVGVGLLPTGRPERRAGSGVVGQGRHQAERQSSHRLDAVEIDQVHVVAGAVVLIVEAGVEHERGYAGHDEGVVIGIFLEIPEERQFQFCRVRGIVVRVDHGRPHSGARTGAVGLDAAAPQPADHVEVHGEDERPARERRRPLPQEV